MHSSTPGLSKSVDLLNSNQTHHHAEVHAEYRPSENDDEYDDEHHDDDYVHHAIRTNQPEDITRTTYYLDSDKEWQYHGSSKNESSDKERFSSISGGVGQRLSSSEKDRNSLEGRSDSEQSRNARLADTKTGVSVAARLEELLSKTNEIIEMERVARKKNKEVFSMFAAEKTAKPRKYSKYFVESKDRSRLGVSGVSSGEGRSTAASETYEDSLVQQSTSRRNKNDSISLQIAHDMEKITSSLLGSSLRDNPQNSQSQTLEQGPVSPEIAKEYISKKEQKKAREKEHESSSLLSDGSHNMLYSPEFSSQEARRLKVTPAKRIDMRREAINGNRSSSSRSIGTPPNRMTETPNTSMGIGNGSFGSFYQNTTFENGNESANGSYYSDEQHDENEPGAMDTEDERLELSEMANMEALNELKSRILNGAHWRDQLLIKGLSEVVNEQIEDNPGALASPIRNKVQELVAKLQSSSQPSEKGDYSYRNDNAEQSESSDDDEEEDEVDGEVASGYNVDGSDVLDMLPMERDKPQSTYRNSHRETSTFNTFSVRPPTSSRPKPFVELPDMSSEFAPISIPTFVGSSSLQPAQSIIDTRYLIPKDAYFHELPHRSRLPVYPPPQDQGPSLHYGTTSFTSHQHTTHSFVPQPSTSPRNKPETSQTLLVTSRPVFYQSHHVLPSPHQEKLLSNRKFTQSHLSQAPLMSQPIPLTERAVPENGTTHFLNIDQVQMERDANNDSGFSTRLSGGSQNGHSPSLSGRIERDAAMVSQNVRIDEYPRMNGTIDENAGVSGATHFEPYFLANIGASSLV